MKTTQILALVALSLGFLSTAKATIEILNTTNEPLLVMPTYPNQQIPELAFKISAQKTGYIEEGFTKLEITSWGPKTGHKVR